MRSINDRPSFADQGTSAPYGPEEEDAVRNLLFETVANTRLNQWLSIHPTTDEFAAKIDRARDEVYNGSKRDFIACYNDHAHMLTQHRQNSAGGIDFLTMRDGRDAPLLALTFRHPRDGLEPGLGRTPPVELARTPHPRFGFAADDTVARVDNEVSMKDDDSEG